MGAASLILWLSLLNQDEKQLGFLPQPTFEELILATMSVFPDAATASFSFATPDGTPVTEHNVASLTNETEVVATPSFAHQEYTVLSNRPRIFHFPHFITDAEADAMIKLGATDDEQRTVLAMQRSGQSPHYASLTEDPKKLGTVVMFMLARYKGERREEDHEKRLKSLLTGATEIELAPRNAAEEVGVNVVVRCRPLLPQELAKGQRDATTLQGREQCGSQRTMSMSSSLPPPSTSPMSCIAT